MGGRASGVRVSVAPMLRADSGGESPSPGPKPKKAPKVGTTGHFGRAPRIPWTGFGMSFGEGITLDSRLGRDTYVSRRAVGGRSQPATNITLG